MAKKASDMTATERAATLVHRLSLGQQLTVAQVAKDMDMTVRGARYLMNRASRTVPIFADRGVWRMHTEKEDPDV